MRKIIKKNNWRVAQSRVAQASRAVVEQVESRVMLSTTLAAWAFDTLPGATSTSTIQTSPATTGGVAAGATAYTVGMQSGSANGYLYPATGANATADASTFLAATGSADSGGNGGSEGGTNGFVWRVESGQDSGAPIGSQGVQFSVPTTNASGISVQWDMNTSSTGAEAQFYVEYTLDINDANPVWINCTNLLGFGPNDTANTVGVTPSIGTSPTNSVYIQNNTSNGSIVTGDYATITGPLVGSNTSWLNDLSVTLPTGMVTGSADNSANFAFRIVNAATGTYETTVAGAPGPTFKNWRFNDIAVVAAGAANSAPAINTNPVSQTVPAGSPVTFSASASGNPTPTVQWWFSTNGGTSYAMDTTDSGNTTNALSFTTSMGATDNGNEYEAVFTNSQGSITSTPATLTDTLAAPLVTAQPSADTVTSGNTATFVAAASGSPVPTVQWYSGPSSTSPFTTVGASGQSPTYSFTSAQSQNGTWYEATFTNSQGSITTNSVKLTVAGATIAAWVFPSVVAAPDNSPAATTGTGTASSLGMTNTYAYATTTATNSVTNDDITSVAGTGTVTENDWRVRGHYVSTGTAPNNGTVTNSGNVNGWNLNAPQYTQGVEFDVSTVGFTSITALFDWESTAQGVKNLQEQYNTNITNSGGWTNINSPLVAVAGNYLLGNVIDVSGIAGANNDPNFGIRLVSVYDPNGAADGLSMVTDANGTHYPYASATSGPYNNSSGNWGFDNIQITGTPIPVAPAITADPTNQSILVGGTATFTAAASGIPTPTVQWQVSTNGGISFSPDTTDTGNTTGTLKVTGTSLNNGFEYEAIFTNNQGSATTTAASMAVSTLPAITTQPTSQNVTAGTTVTLVAAASGSPAPTVQWEYSIPSAPTTFMNVSGPGGTSATYTFAATEASTGDEYEAVFTNPGGSATSMAATVVVVGTPITQWNFTQGVAPGPNGSGPGNMPAPTYVSSSSNSDSSSVLGLSNDYSGTQSFPEADILPIRSTDNASFNEYLWRVRGGGGSGPTGSPGTPDGWSQNAPEYNNGTALNGQNNDADAQGVQFDVNTTGYSNITLQFNWTQGGLGDMQAQYSPDGGTTWVSVGPVVQGDQAAPVDYYGITATTTPTGVLINLQNITAANNNANFELRLVSAYDPGLPNISDQNQLDPAVHGQYPKGFASSGADALQTVTPGTLGDNFTLTYDNLAKSVSQTTGTITYSSNPATMIANILAALTATFTNNATLNTAATGTPSFTVTAANGIGTQYSIDFGGSAGKLPQYTMTINSADSSAAAATWVNGVAPTTTKSTAPYTITAGVPLAVAVTTGTGSKFLVGQTISFGLSKGATGTQISGIITNITGDTITFMPENSGSAPTATTMTLLAVTPFVDGSGSWGLGNISFNGDALNGKPGISVQPASETSAGGYAATFTAAAYSESLSLPSVTWYLDGSPVSLGTLTNGTITDNGTVTANGGAFTSPTPPGLYTSTFSFITDTNLDQNNDSIYAVFTNSNGSSQTLSATLTVVTPEAPIITLQPLPQSVQAGFPAQFVTAATGLPNPTSEYWQISSNGGTSYTPLSDSITVSGSQTYTLTYTTNPNASENGDLFQLVVTNEVGTTYSNAVPMTVLTAENILDDWDFNSLDPTVNSSGGSADPYINSPTPVAAGVDNSLGIAGGSAAAINMTLPLNPSDPATGGPNGAINADDIVNSPGSANPNFNENTWRPRAGITATSGGTPANGWSNFAPDDSQGAQFSVPTTGFGSVYVTLDWYSTTSGILDAQEQYNTPTIVNVTAATRYFDTVTLTANNSYAVGETVSVAGLTGGAAVLNSSSNPNSSNPFIGSSFTITAATSTSFSYYEAGADVGTSNGPGVPPTPLPQTGSAEVDWLNLGPVVQAVSNDFYGATATGGPIPLVFDLTKIPAATNDSTFGIRLVSTYDAGLAQIQNPADPNHGDDLIGQYANAALVGSPPGPAPYNGSKGNWRFDNIVFHGMALTTTGITDNGPNSNNSTQAVGLTVNVNPVNDGTLGAVPNNDTVIIEDASNNDAVVPTTGGTLSGGSATLTIAAGTLSAGSHNLFAVYGGDANFLGSHSSTVSQVTVTAVPPTLSSTQVGSGDVQRSSVNSISVTFSAAVNFSTSSFSLYKQALNANGTINTNIAPTDVSAGVTATSSDNITWTFNVIPGGILDRPADKSGTSGVGFFSNGVFQLVLHGAQITDAATSSANFNGGSDQIAQFSSVEAGGMSNYFHVLFGDWNGDGTVNAKDYFQFKNDYLFSTGQSGFNAAFDYNDDGTINASDYFQFKNDYLISYTY